MFRYASKSSSRTAASALLSVRRTSFRPSSFLRRRQEPAPPAQAGVTDSAFVFPRQYSPRWISSTTVICRNERRSWSAPAARTQNPAIAINKRLVALGKKKQWEELLIIAEQERRNFNNVNCATLMSQLGHIRSFDRSDPRFLEFVRELAETIEERGLPWIQARQAANIVHAIGKMKLRNPSTKKVLQWISNPVVAARFVMEGIPQAVSNVAWACAKLGFESPNLFAEIERQSIWLIEEGDPQGVANMAWAFATLGFEAPNLFAEIEKRSKWLVEEGTPQAVANTAWACATLGFQAPKLLAEIECRSKWLVDEGNPQEVANTAWACATLGFEAPKLFAEIECRPKWLVEEGNPQNVANTAWACAETWF